MAGYQIWGDRKWPSEIRPRHTFDMLDAFFQLDRLDSKHYYNVNVCFIELLGPTVWNHFYVCLSKYLLINLNELFIEMYSMGPVLLCKQKTIVRFVSTALDLF